MRPPIPPASAVPANPLANNSFWNQPQLTKVWDVAHLKPDDERRLRDELHELIVHFNPLVEDPSPWLSRVEDAAEPFLKSLRRKEIHYKFFILNSDVVNAFSIPGGNVYISRGLFDLIGEDEDYALQFAIGHEIAHVDLEHAIKCLRDPGVMKMTEGTLQKLFMLILPFGYLAKRYTVDQEFEADEWVANRMQRLGRTRREILVFLQKLEGYSKNHGFYDGERQAAARPRFVPARKPLSCPDGRPETAEALESVHGTTRKDRAMNRARTVQPITGLIRRLHETAKIAHAASLQPSLPSCNLRSLNMPSSCNLRSGLGVEMAFAHRKGQAFDRTRTIVYSTTTPIARHFGTRRAVVRRSPRTARLAWSSAP